MTQFPTFILIEKSPCHSCQSIQPAPVSFHTTTFPIGTHDWTCQAEGEEQVIKGYKVSACHSDSQTCILPFFPTDVKIITCICQNSQLYIEPIKITASLFSPGFNWVKTSRKWEYQMCPLILETERLVQLLSPTICTFKQMHSAVKLKWCHFLHRVNVFLPLFFTKLLTFW